MCYVHSTVFKYMPNKCVVLDVERLMVGGIIVLFDMDTIYFNYNLQPINLELYKTIFLNRYNTFLLYKHILILNINDTICVYLNLNYS